MSMREQSLKIYSYLFYNIGIIKGISMSKEQSVSSK